MILSIFFILTINSKNYSLDQLFLFMNLIQNGSILLNIEKPRFDKVRRILLFNKTVIHFFYDIIVKCSVRYLRVSAEVDPGNAFHCVDHASYYLIAEFIRWVNFDFSKVSNHFFGLTLGRRAISILNPHATRCDHSTFNSCNNNLYSIFLFWKYCWELIMIILVVLRIEFDSKFIISWVLFLKSCLTMNNF